MLNMSKIINWVVPIIALIPGVNIFLAYIIEDKIKDSEVLNNTKKLVINVWLYNLEILIIVLRFNFISFDLEILLILFVTIYMIFSLLSWIKNFTLNGIKIKNKMTSRTIILLFVIYPILCYLVLRFKETDYRFFDLGIIMIFIFPLVIQVVTLFNVFCFLRNILMKNKTIN